LEHWCGDLAGLRDLGIRDGLCDRGRVRRLSWRRRGEVDVRRLRHWIQDDFGFDLTVVEELTVGTDRDARSWRAVGDEGERYAVKLSSGGTSAGLLVPAHLARLSLPGVVSPLPTLGGGAWARHGEARLSVVPWVGEQRALDGTMTGAHWTALGAVLAAVHAAPLPPVLVQVLPRESDTHDQLGTLLDDVDRAVSGVSASSSASSSGSSASSGSAPADALAQRAARIWAGAAADVRTLRGAADRLAEALRAEVAPHVLCHADAHLGNVLIGRHGRVWLVDWDDALLAPPERDLVVAMGGVLADAPVTPQQRSWFAEGYGRHEFDVPRLVYYRCVRALVDLAEFVAEAMDVGGATPSRRAAALRNAGGILSPTGAVPLALGARADREAGGPRW
jgi:spectinomycin phosphotransferase